MDHGDLRNTNESIPGGILFAADQGMAVGATSWSAGGFLRCISWLGSYFLFLQEQIKDIIIIHPGSDPGRAPKSPQREMSGTPSEGFVQNTKR
jgi:hypothetical protein